MLVVVTHRGPRYPWTAARAGACGSTRERPTCGSRRSGGRTCR
jgi:hypothetical protein